MTIFRLKELASTSVHAAADAIGWHYDRAELIADGVIHAVGVLAGIIAATVLVVLTAVYASAIDIVGVSIYVAGLLSMLVFSATYNLWPVSRAKWVLRRLDHSAIYLLIAATYTPFILELKDSVFALALLVGVWCVAILGIVLKLVYPGRFDRVSVGIYLAMGWSGLMLYDAVLEKLVYPGRFDRVSVGIYLAMGWSGLMLYDAVLEALPTMALWFVVAGGALYSLGVIFHAWRRLRFQNAIWHGFVLAGAACHYTAVLDLVLN
jgi:hemolysin III